MPRLATVTSPRFAIPPASMTDAAIGIIIVAAAVINRRLELIHFARGAAFQPPLTKSFYIFSAEQ